MSKGKPTAARRLTMLKKQLQDFADIAKEAREADSHTAAVAAQKGARDVESEIERVQAVQELDGITDVEQRLLREAELAMMDGSFVAAAQLENRAAEVRKAREDAERARAEAEAAKAAASTTLDAATAAAVDALKGLPEAVRAAIKLQL